MLWLLVGVVFSQSQASFESLLSSAQQAQARGDFQAAGEFYRQALLLHPEIAELKANLGLMYYQIGRDADAIDAFRQSIRLKPDLFVPNLFLGREYLKLKRFNEAFPYLKRASLSKPTDFQVQMSLAEAYTNLGKTRLAIASYSHAQQIDPQDADVWYHLGVSYLEQVEADSRTLLANHKNSPYFQVLLADTFSEQHALIQATDAYQKALASPQVPLGTHASFGFVLLNRYELAGAEREFNAELKSNSGSLMAKLGFVRLHAEQGKTEEAAKELEEIWTTDAGFVRMNATSFIAGIPEEKRAELQRALGQRRENGEISAQLAAVFRNGNDEALASARTAFNIEKPSASTQGETKATELYTAGRYRQCSDRLSPRSQVLSVGELRILAFCAYSTGDYQHAFDAASKMALNGGTEAEGLYWEIKSAQRLATEALTHASEIDSSSPKLHILLGDIYRDRKLFPDAEGEYRKALLLQPDDTGALFGLSLALLGDNQVDQAFRVVQGALKNSSDDPELNAVMGEVLCARHDFAGAEPYLKKSLNTKPEYIPHVHALLGKVYAQTGRTEQAIAEFKLALAADKDGTVHYQLGRLYLKIGDRNSAKQAFDVSQRLRGEGLNRAIIAMREGEDDGESQ